MHYLSHCERGMLRGKITEKCNTAALANRYICCLSWNNDSSMSCSHIHWQRFYYCNSASFRTDDSGSSSNISDLCRACTSVDNNIDSKSSRDDTNNTNAQSTALLTGNIIPVYLKPSRSALRKPSFYIPRLRDAAPESYAFQVDGLGSALPLFSIFASSCEYFAMRIPLIKAGFKRVPMHSLQIKSNLVWGRSALPVLLMRERDVVRIMQRISNSGGGNIGNKKTWDELLSWCKCNEIRNSYQVFNHFPQSHSYLGCKRGLGEELRNLVVNNVSNRSSLTSHVQEKIKDMYSFSPPTWFYPQEREKLFAMMAAAPSDSWFIWKPARGSCGRGIQLVQGGASHATQWTKLANEIDYRAKNSPHAKLYSSYVVQEYITNPLLLHGRKMDLRLYVAVTSFNPLIVYWHEEGLVRLAAEVYEPDVIGNICNSDSSNSNRTTSNNSGGCTTGEHEEKDGHVQKSSKMHFNVYRHLTNYSIGRTYNTTSPSTTCSSPCSVSVTHSPRESESMDEENNDNGSVHANTSTNGAPESEIVNLLTFPDYLNNEESHDVLHDSASETTNTPHPKLSSLPSESSESSQTEEKNLKFEESSPEGTWLKWSLEKLWSYLDHDYNKLQSTLSKQLINRTCNYNNISNVNIKSSSSNSNSSSSSNNDIANCIELANNNAAQRGMTPLLSERVKREIGLLIVRTLMAVKPKMQRAVERCNKEIHNNFFEVYGFDVMLDDALHCHLIEVNTLPSLASTSSFDYATKTNVISDALNLAMMEPFARNPESIKEYTINSHATSPPAPEVMKYVHSEDKRCKSSSYSSIAYGCIGKAESSKQVNSYSHATVRKDVIAPSVAKELQWQLQDEVDYARGFKLLYPPVNASVLPAVAEDILIFADLGLLTPRD